LSSSRNTFSCMRFFSHLSGSLFLFYYSRVTSGYDWRQVSTGEPQQSSQALLANCLWSLSMVVKAEQVKLVQITDVCASACWSFISYSSDGW